MMDLKLNDCATEAFTVSVVVRYCMFCMFGCQHNRCSNSRLSLWRMMFSQTTCASDSRTSVEDTPVCGVAITFGCWYTLSAGFAGSCVQQSQLGSSLIRIVLNKDS